MNSTSAETAKPRKARRSRLGAALRALIRARITAGLLLVLPIYLSYVVVKFIFELMRDSSQWALVGLLENPWFQEHIWKHATPHGARFSTSEVLQAYPALNWVLALSSVLLTILFLYGIGVFTANVLGRRIIQWIELLLDKVPLVKTVYRASKQILATFASDEERAFQRVAIFPFLSPGVYSLGFVTSVFKDAATGEEYVTIFYATTPNPTTGFVFALKRSEVCELDWSVEDALRAIMSGGILMPSIMPMPQGQGWRGPPSPCGSPMPPSAVSPVPAPESAVGRPAEPTESAPA